MKKCITIMAVAFCIIVAAAFLFEVNELWYWVMTAPSAITCLGVSCHREIHYKDNNYE